MPEPTPLNEKQQAVLDNMTAYEQQSNESLRTAAQSHHLNMASIGSAAAGAAASFRTLYLGLNRRPVGRPLGVAAAMMALTAGTVLAGRELGKRSCTAYDQAGQRKQEAAKLVQSGEGRSSAYWRYLSRFTSKQPQAVVAQLVTDEAAAASKACQLASGGVLASSALLAVLGENPRLSMKGGGFGLVLMAASKGLEYVRAERQQEADKYKRMADHQIAEATAIMMNQV